MPQCPKFKDKAKYLMYLVLFVNLQTEYRMMDVVLFLPKSHTKQESAGASALLAKVYGVLYAFRRVEGKQKRQN
jgi:hypothetical protein